MRNKYPCSSHRKNPGFSQSSLFYERVILLIMGTVDRDFQVSCPSTLWWHLRILAAHCKLAKDWGQFKATRWILRSPLTILTRDSYSWGRAFPGREIWEEAVNCLSGCRLRAGGVGCGSVLWNSKGKREVDQDLWVKGLRCLPLHLLCHLSWLCHLNP